MRTRRDQHSLSYPLRLPDEIQAEALRLLAVCRQVITLTLRALWGRLDEFATRTNGYAYKQVEEMIPPPLVHGHPQWRGFGEQAGRILRGQAERKQQFALILAVLKAGILPYAGDDGKALGQTYPMSYDLDQKQLTLALRTPDEQGAWGRTWREKTCQMPLPDLLVERVQAGKTLAPSLREIVEADGAGYAVLDFIVEVAVERPVTFEDIQTLLGFDWGVRMLVRASVVDLDGHQVGHPFFLDTGPFDGRQARLRRQIDQLKAKVARLETQRDRFPVGDKRRKPSCAIGGILPRCVGNSGVCCATHVTWRECASNGSNPAIPRMSVRAVAVRPPRTRLPTIATRSLPGEPGSAAPITSASGMAPEILRLRSISPAWAQR